MIELKRWGEDCFELRAIAEIQFLHHRKHTVVSITKTDRLMLLGETIAVLFSKNYVIYTTTLCEQRVEFFNVKAGSIYCSYQCSTEL